MKRLFRYYISSFKGLPRAAWLLALVVFLNRSGSMVLFFMTLYLTKNMNHSISDAGKIISIYGAGALVGSYLGGWLSDKIGTRHIQFFSLLLSGVGIIFLGFVTDLIGIAIMMFSIAVIAESFRPANATAFAQVCSPEQRARGFVLNRVIINLGITIGPAIGGFLAMIDYSYLFWVNGIMCILASILFWILLYRPDIYRVHKETTQNIEVKSPWKDTIFLFFIGLMMVMGIIFFQIFNTWPLYLKETYKLMENQIGSLLAINGFLVVLFEMPLIKKFEKINQLKIITHGSFIFVMGFAILPLSLGYFYAIFTVMIWTFGEMLIFPLSAAFVANRASDSNRGKYMGMYVFAYSIALVIGPSIGSWTYKHYGADILWYGIGIAGALVWFGFNGITIVIHRSEQNN